MIPVGGSQLLKKTSALTGDAASPGEAFPELGAAAPWLPSSWGLVETWQGWERQGRMVPALPCQTPHARALPCPRLESHGRACGPPGCLPPSRSLDHRLTPLGSGSAHFLPPSFLVKMAWPMRGDFNLVGDSCLQDFYQHLSWCSDLSGWKSYKWLKPRPQELISEQWGPGGVWLCC